MSWSHPAYEAVAAFVGRRTGLAFANRHDSAELGIRRAMDRAGAADLVAYLDRLATDAGALDDLLAELTVGETYFFREPAQLAFLRREVLPELRRRGPDRPIRAWSAGCASGEEAYSLAILFDQEGLAAQASVLGTDICRAALAKAWRATYGPWSLRGDGAAAALPYLRPAGKLLQVAEEIRRRVTFEPLNLALDVYPSFATGTWGMDVILCRNVLIYFDRETVRAVAGRMFEALTAGGWLLTAAADPSLTEYAAFEPVVSDEGVFYRKPGEGGGPRIEDRGSRIEDRQGPMELLAGTPDPQPSILDPRSSILDPSTNRTDEARAAFARGEYRRAAALTHDLGDAATAALHVRALANQDVGAAEHACAAAAARHPLCAEIAYLHGVLLLDLGRAEGAAAALRRVLYLDRTLAAAHFTLGSALLRGGDTAGARRAYRNARDLCAACPPDGVVPLGDGETAEVQLALLNAAGGGP
jgi:chemotaxis protein methyltransferase CheR